ncbi:MAG: DinB family protein [Armatimonas sp.]
MEMSQLIESVQKSRVYCLKHLAGMSDEIFEAQPHPECKSARQTLLHLVGVDRSVLEGVKTAVMPDFFAIDAAVTAELGELPRAALEDAIKASHEELLSYIQGTYGDKTPDDTIPLWGTPTPLGKAIPYLSSEDYYHAGQLGYMRLAADPAWDYYTAIYVE